MQHSNNMTFKHTFVINPYSIEEIPVERIESIAVFGDFNDWGKSSDAHAQWKLYPSIPFDNKIKERYWLLNAYLHNSKHEFKYFIRLTDGRELWYPPGENKTIHPIDAPQWLRGRLFYQIFPDSFWRKEEADNPNLGYPLISWMDKPSSYKFYGGNLAGITEQIQKRYFHELTQYNDLSHIIFYLNPVWKCRGAPHRYWPENYTLIDPLLGDNQELSDLISQIHRENGKVILDLVFNHTGVNHCAFQDILRNGYNSPFINWYRKMPDLEHEKIKLPVKANLNVISQTHDESENHHHEVYLRPDVLGNLKPVKLRIINDFRTSDFDYQQPSYFNLWDRRYLLPIKNYCDTYPFDYPSLYGLVNSNLINQFKRFAYDYKLVWGDDWKEFLQFATQLIGKVEFQISRIILYYYENHIKTGNNTYTSNSQWQLINLYNAFREHKGLNLWTTLDLVNMFNRYIKLPDLSVNRVIQTYFNKPLTEITLAEILQDQDYYQLTESELNYDCWWKIWELPTLNTHNSEVRNHLFKSAQKLIEAGVDGFRLDVPEEIKSPPNDDSTFWEEFRVHCVNKFSEIRKLPASDFYILGEVWGDNLQVKPWLRHRTEDPGYGQAIECDAVMNYGFRRHAVNYFGNIELDTKSDNHQRLDLTNPATKTLLGLTKDVVSYPAETLDVMYNLLDSHDSRRILAVLQLKDRINNRQINPDELVKRMYAAVILQLTYPGLPVIYYGSEWGLTGLEDDGYDNSDKTPDQKGSDPYCRGSMPFGWLESLPELKKQVNQAYQKALSLLGKHPALLDGVFIPVYANDELGIIGYSRIWQGESLLVLLTNGNGGDELANFLLPPQALQLAQLSSQTQFVELVTKQQYTLNGDGFLPIDMLKDYAIILKPQT